MVLSRREFALTGISGLAFAGARRIPVALQLFSVRRQCQKDLPGTLSRVADIGYSAVEFAGYYGHGPDELKRLLAERRLTCCGAHVSFDSVQPDKLPATIEFHQALGNRSLIVPGLPARATQSHEAWLETAKRFGEISKTLLKSGMRLGYHNHAAEFRPVSGERPWDTLFENTPKEVFIELDLGGAGYGGANPIEALKRYPGRVRFVHVKDYTLTKPDLMIGDGQMDWHEFFPVCEKVAGTEWYVIEHDSDPNANFEDIRECLRRFRAVK
ncbi:MAG TPA: sugar phosphate isomerase/epimerase [Bryobacteraceae bacterium]|nr:sugar phosphate isomerase/epimerase [Bryobacteraceae bacterium]